MPILNMMVQFKQAPLSSLSLFIHQSNHVRNGSSSAIPTLLKFYLTLLLLMSNVGGTLAARHFSVAELIVEKYLLSSLTVAGILGNVLFYACTLRVKRKPHFYVYIYYLLVCDISATLNFLIWPIAYIFIARSCDFDHTTHQVIKDGHFNPYTPIKQMNSNWVYVNDFNGHMRPHTNERDLDRINSGLSVISRSDGMYYKFVTRYHWFLEEFFATSANWMTAFIGFDRIYALYKPLSYGRNFTKRKIILICLVFSIISALFSIPYALMLTVKTGNRIPHPIALKGGYHSDVPIHSVTFDSSDYIEENHIHTTFPCFTLDKEDRNYRKFIIESPLTHFKLNENGSILQGNVSYAGMQQHMSIIHGEFNYNFYYLDQINESWTRSFDKAYVSLMYLIPLVIALTCNAVIFKKIYMNRIKIGPRYLSFKAKLSRKAVNNANNSHAQQTNREKENSFDAKKTVVNIPNRPSSKHITIADEKHAKNLVGKPIKQAQHFPISVISAYKCKKLICKRFNQVSRKAAIKTNILIGVQSSQLFVFNLPYIVFVLVTGYAWSYNYKWHLYNIQLLVHVLKQFNPLLGVYINLIFDSNIRRVYCRWLKTFCKVTKGQIKKMFSRI